MKMSTTVNLPTLIMVNDYHEFDPFEKNLKRIIPGVKVREISVKNDDDVFLYYVGIVYIRRKPSKKVIEELIKNI
jgi:hypothetical protein